MTLSLVTPAADYPLTLAQAKAHARITQDAEDALVEDLIAGAVELFERETGRQLMSATWRYTIDRFPRGREPIRLPRPPLQSVTSVSYLDASGAEQVWDAGEYTVSAPAGPSAGNGTIHPKPQEAYPTTYPGPGAVWVEFTAGYALADDVPPAVRVALSQIVASLSLNREAPDASIAKAIEFFRPAVYA